MKTKKLRRHSGRKIPDSTLMHEMKKRDIINRCLDPQEFWDDWDDYRDGQRDWFRDGSKIKRKVVFSKWVKDRMMNKRILLNKKNKRWVKIRKAKKSGRCKI